MGLESSNSHFSDSLSNFTGKGLKRKNNMNNKFLKATLTGLIFSVTSLFNVANAGLIEADYSASGDNLAAFDTTTGLTWLDFSETKFLTYNQALSFSVDFRLASSAEIASLYNSLVGNASERYDQFEAVGLFNSPDRSAAFVSGAGLVHVTPTGYHPAAFGYGVWNDADFGGDSIAMFMVNTQSFQSPTVANAVPEPSTIAIFALGIMGLASRRFKKQA